jgi:type IV pilus assembly protein PilN
MMIRINLLRPDSIKKEERTELLTLAYAVIFLAVAACGGVYYMKYRSYQTLDGRIRQVEGELSKYESIVKQVDALQATKKVLETKKSVIDGLMAGRLLYPQFMEKLLSLMPGGISFRSMSTQTQPDGTLSVTLDADALDNYAIADFVTSLSSDTDFSDVELGAITTGTSGKTAISGFHVTFQYHRKQS